MILLTCPRVLVFDGGRVVVGRRLVVVGEPVVGCRRVVVGPAPGGSLAGGPVGGAVVVDGPGGPAGTSGPVATPPWYRRAQPSTAST